MGHIRKVSGPEELVLSSCWTVLKQTDREFLLSEKGAKLSAGKNKAVTLAWIAAPSVFDRFVLWVRIDPEEGSFGGVCLPEDFSPEQDLPEDLAEEIFELLDLLEEEYLETIVFHSDEEAEEDFWNEIGLLEQDCLCLMRSGNERIPESGVGITLQKVPLLDPVFRSTLSESFGEPEEVYLGQIRDTGEEACREMEALLILSEERIVGQALITPYEKGFQLSYFGILPGERRKGCATKAFSLIRQKYRPLFLSVEEGSEAYRLYERGGMEPYRYLISFLLDREPKNY